MSVPPSGGYTLALEYPTGVSLRRFRHAALFLALTGALFTLSPVSTPAQPPRKLVDPPATDPATMKVAKGFKVELLFSVPKDEMGSWVCMGVDPKGRLI